MCILKPFIVYLSNLEYKNFCLSKNLISAYLYII